MLEPLVSIIIPNFNRSSLIGVALNSLIRQSYKNWECIVVDDGSTDKSLSILQNFRSMDNRIYFYRRNRLPKGAPTCRNIGLEKSKGTLVIFLDSDDYLLDFCLEQRVKALNKLADNDFAVFPMGIEQNNEIITSKLSVDNEPIIQFLSADLPWSIMSPIWRKEFLISLNGFTVGYPRFNDPELMIRALLKTNNYSIFDSKKADCVYIPSVNVNDFTDKVCKSIKLLIPDVISNLKEYKKIELKTHLIGYLFLWFKYIYKPSQKHEIKSSLQIIFLFTKFKIISVLKCLNLITRLFLFSLTSKYLKKPIDKLTYKNLYF